MHSMCFKQFKRVELCLPPKNRTGFNVECDFVDGTVGCTSFNTVELL